MKRTHAFTGAAVAALISASPLLMAGLSPAAAQAVRSETRTTRVTDRGSETVTVETLRTKVEPLGEFVQIRGAGEAWRPSDIDRGWKPYTNGRWIFNREVGWYFESNEPWAEVTYHYGRWYEDPDQGWVWVADTRWAPAWVEWRRSKSHVGWRPLPPENLRTASRRSTGSTRVVESEEWVFVPTREITAERISTVIVEDNTRVTEIYRETRPAGRVEVRGGYAVNLAIQPSVIERDANIRIETRNIPRAEAVPVPAPVRSIATEARPTPAPADASAAGRRPAPGQDQTGSTAPAGTAKPQRPGDQPSGSATAPGDTTRRPAEAERRQGQAEPNATEPNGRRPAQAGTDRKPDDKDQANRTKPGDDGKDAKGAQARDAQAKDNKARDNQARDNPAKDPQARDAQAKDPSPADARRRNANAPDNRRPNVDQNAAGRPKSDERTPDRRDAAGAPAAGAPATGAPDGQRGPGRNAGRPGAGEAERVGRDQPRIQQPAGSGEGPAARRQGGSAETTGTVNRNGPGAGSPSGQSRPGASEGRGEQAGGNAGAGAAKGGPAQRKLPGGPGGAGD